MAITYPYRHYNYILYEGDIGPGRGDLFSLILLLEDSVTGEAPIGRVAASLKGTRRKPFKNLSGAICFKGLMEGSYPLEIESDYYEAKKETIVIEDNHNDLESRRIKIERITLVPKPSYPFGNEVILQVRIYDAEEKPPINVQVHGRLLTPACFLKSSYDDFLNRYSDHKKTIAKYAVPINAKVCIYPEKITDEERQQLGKAYTELETKASQRLRGSINFDYKEFATFVKDKVIGGLFSDECESDNGRSVILILEKINADDRQKIPPAAFDKLIELSSGSSKKEACFTHKKYAAYFLNYFMEDNVLKTYLKDRRGKIHIDLNDISETDLGKISEQILTALKKRSQITGTTDENGECILVFGALKNKFEKVELRIEKEGRTIRKTADLAEGQLNVFKSTFP
jgi:hypothetical protein